jgi:hypothetical protein
MWQRPMAAFLCGKGQVLWDVTMNTAYVHSINFLAPGSRDMLITYFTLTVNLNSVGSRQKIFLVGFGSS